VNISDLINASVEEEPLPFIVDENILKIISENSTDSRVRVIVKYKKESAPTSVKEYIDDVKDSSVKLLAEESVVI
jgi:hypothetical protein